jgi:DNA-binding NtrC family response regulator
VQRIGGEREIEVDVRIMAATNRDLEEEIKAEQFRRDLYYRLGVVTLSVPPLRERREDIPDLVRSYLEVFEVRLGRQFDGISTAAMKNLTEYDWPGNVRELINVMERAVLLCPTDQIEVDDLPENITGLRGSGQGPLALDVMNDTDWLARPLKEARAQAIETVERAYLEALLHQTAGQIGVAARRAGISVRSLYQKMQQYGLRKEDFKLR